MMTRGTKRLAGSDSSAPDSNDSALQSKRVMAAPRFDVHRAEPSHQHLAAEPKLDVQRAQLCHLHVRALNTQYASWVQSQLQNHPDELWQDGTKDYITHASHIMEKFSDVVAWLRANASKTESMPIAAVSNNQKSSVSGVEGNKAEPHPGMNSGSSADGTVSHTGLWSSALSSDAHQPVLQGYQGAFAKTEASEDLDEGYFLNPRYQYSDSVHNDPEVRVCTLDVIRRLARTVDDRIEAEREIESYRLRLGTYGEREMQDAIMRLSPENEVEKPSSPSLKRTEEKGIVIVYEVKCKLYVKPDNPAEKGWKDMGVGHLSIKCKEGAGRATKESKPTIVIRNDVGKILLNALIYPGIKMNIQKNTIASVFHTLGGQQKNGNEPGKDALAVARTCLLRMKTEEETAKLAAAINECTPSA